MLVRWCFCVLILGCWLRLAAAVVDNDVLGLFRLSYQPRALVARVLCAVDYLVSFPALTILGVLLILWAVREMAL